MAKKELRLAVVIYGGASLAVYMHGISKELLKVVRASKVLHEVGMGRAADMRYRDGPDSRPGDTEAVYFEILKQINRDCHFRVVIDVLAGASAGAINGVMLAKALVDDSLLDAQTEGWLEDADAEQLSAERVSPWRKWYLHPFLRALSFWLPPDIRVYPETRAKLARLVRSSWFRPPFSGERLCHHFFAALQAMTATRRPGSSLLPPGQRLDVYASITDLVGYPRTVQVHEQLIAREREHAAFCQLTHVASEAGVGASDFRDDNDPALVWTARASSSYAGAFPPFHHGEMRRVLAERGVDWPREQSFLAGSVRARDGSPAVRHFDPGNRWFVDGGIVNNKPFRAALEALNHRPADRRVMRRLVYIEPDPSTEELSDPGRSLGYLATIRAAISTIPRNQPIVDELSDIVAQDARVQVNRRIVDANRGHIERMVREVRVRRARQPMTGSLVTELRLAMLDRAEQALGLAYHSYVQRRLWRLLEALVEAWTELSPADDPALRRALEQSLAPAADPAAAAVAAAAAAATGTADGGGAVEAPELRPEHPQEALLARLDVTFRIRGLQFLIRRLNQRSGDRSLDEISDAAIDRFKERAYRFMERCYGLRRGEHIGAGLADRLMEASLRAPLPPEPALALLDELAESLALEALDAELDQAFCEFVQELEDEALREALIGDYLGFPLYDVLLPNSTTDGGPDPLTPIRVERISPADAPTLAGVFGGLRCRRFMGFVGFFSRPFREHDYLWGRLNGAERIVDLLAGAAGDAIPDPAALKRRVFEAIVEGERGRLRHCDADLDGIAREIARLG
jgi:patatin-related protein